MQTVVYIINNGVTIPRALKKWLDKNPEGKPADLIIFLGVPTLEGTSSGHTKLSNQIFNDMDEIIDELFDRGVNIIGFM